MNSSANLPANEYQSKANPKTTNDQSNDIPSTVGVNVEKQALWNLCIVVVAALIILYPQGMFDISLLDKATVDCSVYSDLDSELGQLSEDLGIDLEEGYANLEDECKKVRLDSQISVLVVISISLILLIWNNNRPPPPQEINRSKRVVLPSASRKSIIKENKSIAKPEKKNIDAEIEKSNYRKDSLSTFQLSTICLIVTTFLVIQFIPLFATISNDASDNQESSSKSSLYFILNCELDVEDDERYCTSNAKTDALMIEFGLMVMALLGVFFTFESGQKNIQESDSIEDTESEEE